MQECKITKPQSEITNNGYFYASGSNGIFVDTTIGSFINYGELASQNKEIIRIADKLSDNRIDTLTNYGTISGHIYTGNHSSIGTITNYGIMGSIYTSHIQDNHIAITINNLGIMNTYANNNRVEANLITKNSNASFVIQNYTIKIDETPTEFLAFSGYKTDDSAKKNSHLVVSLSNDSNIRFKDGDSKIILDFGSDFKEGEPYKLNKLIVNTDGTTALNVDFNRLMPRNDLYHITQSGDSFVVNPKPESSTIGNLYKSNIRTMNNFYTISNSMIYPHKFAKKRVVKKKRVRRIKRTAESSLKGDYMESHPLSSLRDSTHSVESWQSTNLDSIESLESLESHESFAYKSDSNNLSDSTTYTNQNNINHIRIANIDETNQRTNRNRISTNHQAKSTIPSQSDNYYFILTPFINHNYFFESGRYNLSGLEYGFLTTFSGKLTPSNTLGTHFIMSYGSLNDVSDKNFHIKNINLNLGINYKLDMIWDSYIKARGDFYYFLNQVQTIMTSGSVVKPNTIGFGASVAYGKEWDFRDNGVLGVEVGLDYKGLFSPKFDMRAFGNTKSSYTDSYESAVYNLLYLDVGLNYAKYFNTSVGLWGLHTGLGVRGNVSANYLAKSKISLHNGLRIWDMKLDNDYVLGYINISGSYVLNHKNFDMEFSLAYYGNYGDRVISNGGGVEWRTTF